MERRRPRRRKVLYNFCILHGGELGLGRGQLLQIQASRFSKHRRTRQSQKMVVDLLADLLARFIGCEPIGREDIWKLGKEVGDALGSGDKGSMVTRGRGWSRRGQADLKGTSQTCGSQNVEESSWNPNR